MVEKVADITWSCRPLSATAIDADTVFLRRPDKVDHWARGGVESGLYLHDQEARNAEAVCSQLTCSLSDYGQEIHSSWRV